jgi:hypothetical protein
MPDLSGVSSSISAGKLPKVKPPLIQLNTSDRPERVSGIGIAHWAVFLFFAAHLQEISNG